MRMYELDIRGLDFHNPHYTTDRDNLIEEAVKKKLIGVNLESLTKEDMFRIADDCVKEIIDNDFK